VPFGAFTLKPPTHTAPSALHAPLVGSQEAPRAQSVSTAQRFVHSPSRHVEAPQSVASGIAQSPALSQRPAPMRQSPMHEASLQAVALLGYAQPSSFLPSQVPAQGPSPPHGARPGFGAPVTATHWPGFVGSPHHSHCVSHTEMQHTPSTQNPPEHWSFAVQAAPWGRFVAQRPDRQYAESMQSPSFAQPGHVPPTHFAGLQSVPARSVVHVPGSTPSHTCPTAWVPTQMFVPGTSEQSVPAGQTSQAPWPSQRPS
jgi:hypothetical protein